MILNQMVTSSFSILCDHNFLKCLHSQVPELCHLFKGFVSVDSDNETRTYPFFLNTNLSTIN